MKPHCPVQGFLFHAYSLWTSADAWIAASRRKPVLIIRQSRTADGFASPLYVQNEMTTANGRPKLQRHSLVLAVQYHSRVYGLSSPDTSNPARVGRGYLVVALSLSHHSTLRMPSLRAQTWPSRWGRRRGQLNGFIHNTLRSSILGKYSTANCIYFVIGDAITVLPHN